MNWGWLSMILALDFQYWNPLLMVIYLNLSIWWLRKLNNANYVILAIIGIVFHGFALIWFSVNILVGIGDGSFTIPFSMLFLIAGMLNVIFISIQIGLEFEDQTSRSLRNRETMWMLVDLKDKEIENLHSQLQKAQEVPPLRRSQRRKSSSVRPMANGASVPVYWVFIPLLMLMVGLSIFSVLWYSNASKPRSTVPLPAPVPIYTPSPSVSPSPSAPVPTPSPIPASQCTFLPSTFANTTCTLYLSNNQTNSDWIINDTYCNSVLIGDGTCIIPCTNGYYLDNTTLPLNYLGSPTPDWLMAQLNFSSAYMLNQFLSGNTTTVNDTWWGLPNGTILQDPLSNDIRGYGLTAEVLTFYINIVTNINWKAHTVLWMNDTSLLNQCFTYPPQGINATLMIGMTSLVPMVDMTLRFLSASNASDPAGLVDYYCKPGISVPIEVCYGFFTPLQTSTPTTYDTIRMAIYMDLYNLFHSYNSNYLNCMDAGVLSPCLKDIPFTG